jgi:hypothetical protein
MHSWTFRLNAIFTFTVTVLAVLSALNALSVAFLNPEPKATIESVKLQRLPGSGSLAYPLPVTLLRLVSIPLCVPPCCQPPSVCASCVPLIPECLGGGLRSRCAEPQVTPRLCIFSLSCGARCRCALLSSHIVLLCSDFLWRVDAGRSDPMQRRGSCLICRQTCADSSRGIQS